MALALSSTSIGNNPTGQLNSGSAFDRSLIKQPYGDGANSPATINGVPFRIDPDSVSLPVHAKVNKQPTQGGMVVQVFGVYWGDLTVTGQFGIAGWQGQAQFLDQMVNLARKQSMQTGPTLSGQNKSPAQPFMFTYPLLNWQFRCYLKAYSSPDGAAVVHSNLIINPRWTLTLFIDTDTGSLQTVAQNAYLQRLAEGLGIMWNQGQNTYTGYQPTQFQSAVDNQEVQQVINGDNINIDQSELAANLSAYQTTYGVTLNSQQIASIFGGPTVTGVPAPDPPPTAAGGSPPTGSGANSPTSGTTPTSSSTPALASTDSSTTLTPGPISGTLLAASNQVLTVSQVNQLMVAAIPQAFPGIGSLTIIPPGQTQTAASWLASAMTGISGAESAGYNTSIINSIWAIGLWQILYGAAPPYQPGSLGYGRQQQFGDPFSLMANPQGQAAAALVILKEQGFGAWGTDNYVKSFATSTGTGAGNLNTIASSYGIQVGS